MPVGVWEELQEVISQHPLFIGVIDPDLGVERNARLAKIFEEGGADVLFIGGSSGITRGELDLLVKSIKEECSLPVILFPGNAQMLTKYADAVLFMSLMNSDDPYWITGAQVLAAPLVERLGIEPIPTAYLVFEPGMAVGWIGRARVLRRDKPYIALAYALAAQYLGKKVVIMDAGSGAPEPVPADTVKLITSNIDIPVSVGGGIRTIAQARQLVKAGAAGLQIGTVVEQSPNPLEKAKAFAEVIHGG